MTNFKDLTGQKFGRLTVIKRVENDKNGNSQWLCKCECGNEKIVRTNTLKRSESTSCGCLRNEKVKKANTKHGLNNSRIYHIWKGIKHRCNCRTSNGYKIYGGRGIKVCDEWIKDFKAFYDWSIENGYKDNLTIDRIDNNGNYTPNNCRWVTSKKQANNRSNNHIIVYKNERHTLSEWANIYDIPSRLLRDRIIRSNWSFEKAISTPKRKRTPSPSTI